MKVLLTGVTGLLGSYLGRRLVAGGHEVHALVRPGASTLRIDSYARSLRLVESDLARPETYRQRLAEIRPDVAFHLAWYAEPGSFWNALENLDCVAMTMELVRELARCGCGHLVVAGSCAEYRPSTGPMPESTPTQPTTLYGAAKDATRAVLEASAPFMDMTVAWARVFFPFGPGEPEQKLVPTVTRALLCGERAHCSHGRQIRDFIYVEDCADALRAISAAGIKGPVNVGTGEGHSVRTLVETLAELTGRSASDLDFGTIKAVADEAPEIVADIRRLREEAGWQPTHTLHSALAETVDWWRKQVPR